jgi:hypothetical protein
MPVTTPEVQILFGSIPVLSVKCEDDQGRLGLLLARFADSTEFDSISLGLVLEIPIDFRICDRQPGTLADIRVPLDGKT